MYDDISIGSEDLYINNCEKAITWLITTFLWKPRIKVWKK